MSGAAGAASGSEMTDAGGVGALAGGGTAVADGWITPLGSWAGREGGILPGRGVKVAS